MKEIDKVMCKRGVCLDCGFGEGSFWRIEFELVFVRGKELVI